MSSAVLPLLRPSRFGVARVVCFAMLSLFAIGISPGGAIGQWLYWGFVVGLGCTKVVTELYQSRRFAVLPNLARAVRWQVPILMVSAILLVGILNGSVSGLVGASMAMTAWGLALGVPVESHFLAARLRGVISVVRIAAILTLISSRSINGWIQDHWSVALALALLWLVCVAGLLLREETASDRPFAKGNLSTQPWLGRERFLRLDGAATTQRQWLRAARFESALGQSGLAVTCVNWVLIFVAWHMVLAVIVLGHHTGAGAPAWPGLQAALIATAMDSVDGLFLASILGLALLFSPSVETGFPYPLSRRRRWHVSFLGSLHQHGWFIVVGLGFAGLLTLHDLPDAREFVSDSLPGMVRGLLVVSIVAPALQWRGAVGRNNWIQGVPIESPLAALLLWGLYAAVPFLWRIFLDGATVSTELWCYVALLTLSQLTYYLVLRRHFSRADLVPAPA